MADYEIDDPEMKIECPYDKAHMVRKKRMQYHLIKCRRNHVSKDFAVCPFNATHEMPRPELRHHMLTCRDRAVAEKTIRYEEAKRSATNQPILKGNTDVPAYNTYELVETENWDLEVATHPKMGVDPSFFHMNTRRSLAGLTPLEKRKFHTSLIPDMADYNIDETEQYRPVGMAPEPTQERKVRLPKAKSQAETLFEEQRSQVKQPKGPSTVFQYSLAMAGVGRGRGMLSNPPPPFTKPGGIGNGDGPQHVMPASLQAYSLKNSKQNRDSPPPANIMAYMLKNGKKTSSISSSNNSTNASADNSSNEACSDDEDFDGVKPKKQPARSVKDGSSSISSYVLKQPARGRGRGMARQNENKVYNPQVIKPIQNTGIGRGARLQNGNLQPEPAINPNSWASMVNDSRKESRQSTPSPSMISNGYNSNSGDFPALNSSNQFPPSNQPTNGHLNKTDIKTGSLSDHSSGRTTPNNWFDDDIKEDGNIEENCNDEILELAKKQSKNLRKKLVGISKLEEKRNKGVKLTPDELAKVNKRSEFEKELEALSITR